ncbi:hypothetical protein BD626DRAFT_587099 [Schizophyllum amplum]|uniref:F-box domain-containing protein n=1 Tax=Schizophyllum amplum TaxID=97359 RepID=A0A550BVZ2_9AGAR|nr:hypothetical protein BD626DRAFT_587099 [Auriculariopsis ampla]
MYRTQARPNNNDRTVWTLLRKHRDASEPTEDTKTAVNFMLRDLYEQARIRHVQLSPDQRYFVRACHAVSAPWRRLSADVLADIFLLALPDEWHDHCAGSVILPLTQVCHIWREIALGTPRLWTSIKVSLVGSPRRRWAEAVTAYIARSADALLRIHINLALPRDFPFQEAWVSSVFWRREAWAQLCEQAYRWESAHLEAVPAFAFSEALAAPFARLTTLTWFYAAPPGWPSGSYTIPTIFFERAPCLQSVTLCYNIEPKPLVLPRAWRMSRLCVWAGPRRGETGYFENFYNGPLAAVAPWRTLVPALSIVCAARHWLRNLELCVGSLHPGTLQGTIDMSTATEFPMLKRLVLYDDACQLASWIVAPRLREVKVDADGSIDGPASLVRHDPFWGHPLLSVTRLLTRPGGCARLRSLYLSPQTGENVGTLLTCLESVPMLEQLVLDTSENDDFPTGVLRFEIVLALTRRADNSHSLALLPSLVALTLNFDVCMTMDMREDDMVHDADEPYSPVPLYNAVWLMLGSRRLKQYHAGRTLHALRAFSSNINRDLSSWPLPTPDQLSSATRAVEWSSKAEKELSRVLSEEEDPYEETSLDIEETEYCTKITDYFGRRMSITVVILVTVFASVPSSSPSRLEEATPIASERCAGYTASPTRTSSPPAPTTISSAA